MKDTMVAETIKVEVDESGFLLHITSDLDETFVCDIQDVAEALYNEVTGMIGPWLHEREQARGAVGPTGGRWDAYTGTMVYEHSDPKHPDHHDTMAAAADSQS